MFKRWSEMNTLMQHFSRVEENFTHQYSRIERPVWYFSPFIISITDSNQQWFFPVYHILDSSDPFHSATIFTEFNIWHSWVSLYICIANIFPSIHQIRLRIFLPLWRCYHSPISLHLCLWSIVVTIVANSWCALMSKGGYCSSKGCLFLSHAEVAFGMYMSEVLKEKGRKWKPTPGDKLKRTMFCGSLARNMTYQFHFHFFSS